ncbi:MAG: hypothetical protein VZR95_02555 [Alphaproteobacteria bacterium]
MLDYKLYKTADNPKSLVVFLHGYNGNLEDHKYAIDWLKDSLNSAYLATPIAPENCDKNPEKRQWFGMLKYDPEYKRSNPDTSAKEIFKIYSSAQHDLDHRADDINEFITQLQQKLNINNAHTYLVGFSQGAMLTIYTSLTRSEPLAGAFAVAGLVAGADLLEKRISAKPPLYMLHGEDDLRVQYKTLPDSLNWLKSHGVNVNSCTYAHLAHRVNEDEISKISSIINNA